jgi:hypothetical protein
MSKPKHYTVKETLDDPRTWILVTVGLMFLVRWCR